MTVRSPQDYEHIARRKLPHFLYEYIFGGSYNEVTLSKNREDLELIELRQRVLTDVSNISIKTELFGHEWAAPFGLGPIGLSGLFSRRGEVQAAMAAEQAGIPFCLSTLSVCGLDEIHEHIQKPAWFQLYMVKDREFIKDLFARAENNGCNQLILTVDMPVPATRYRDFRSGLSGSPGWKGSLRRFSQILSRPGWLYNVGIRGRPHTFGNLIPALGERSGMNDCVAWIGQNFDPSVAWQELDWIRQHWDHSIIIKGILDLDDAKMAASLGVDGIVVSNHGGRQLDSATSSIKALIPIADALGGKLTILADGGVRSGVDVIKMLAAGADGVLLGRLWAYALAAGGRSGVEDMIGTMKAELLACMAMTGCASVAELNRRSLRIGFDVFTDN